jgi:hypothetical protein
MDNSQKIQVALDFIKYAKSFLNIQKLPKIFFTVDRNWVLGIRSFGQYNSSNKTLTVYMGNRNMADTLRTLAHELVHHKQNEEGKIQPNSGETGSEIENEANSLAGIMMRNYGKKHSIIYESKINEAPVDYDIYCDMDGVLCDFDAQCDHYFGMKIDEYIAEKGEKAFNNAMDEAGEEFWATMPWMPGGQELWNKIGKFGVTILSSPGNYSGAKEGKRQWIKDNLNPQPKDIVFRPTGMKHKQLMGKTNKEIERSVLIDDYSKNLIPWKYMGGRAIKHDNKRDTISAIDKL